MNESLHPDFARYAGTLLEIIEVAKDINPSPETLAELIKEDDEWNEAYGWAHGVLMSNRVTGLGGSAFAVPFLHPSVCKNLVNAAEQLGEIHGHQPNPIEEGPYQIPEIVIKHVDQPLHDALADMIKYLNLWFMLIYQVEPNSISSIQFAKYEPDGTAHGNWHHDRTSDFTAVVSLNPDDFTGGGTDIRLSPTDYHSIPPLPQGYALLLNGKQVHHHGRAVEQGARHLLVFWLDSSV